MRDLRNLLGKRVKVEVLCENDVWVFIEAKVIDVYIDTYHFLEKGEEIRIVVNVEPIKIPNNCEVDDESFADIPLSRVRAYPGENY